MKFTVTFKTPDAVSTGIEAAMTEAEVPFYKVYDDSPQQEKRAQVIADAEAVMKQYVAYSECITVEFDTETMEAKVIKK
jgi:hypothetical protein